MYFIIERIFQLSPEFCGGVVGDCRVQVFPLQREPLIYMDCDNHKGLRSSLFRGGGAKVLPSTRKIDC